MKIKRLLPSNCQLLSHCKLHTEPNMTETPPTRPISPYSMHSADDDDNGHSNGGGNANYPNAATITTRLRAVRRNGKRLMRTCSPVSMRSCSTPQYPPPQPQCSNEDSNFLPGIALQTPHSVISCCTPPYPPPNSFVDETETAEEGEPTTPPSELVPTEMRPKSPFTVYINHLPSASPSDIDMDGGNRDAGAGDKRDQRRRSTNKKKPPKSRLRSSMHKQSHEAPQFQRYILRTLRAVHPDLRLTKRSMECVQNFVVDTFETLTEAALTLTRRRGARTLGDRDVIAAARAMLPAGELGALAESFAAQKVMQYLQNVRKP